MTPMKMRLSAVLPLSMAVLLMACAEEDSDRAGFLVSVLNYESNAPVPDHLTVTWYSESGILFNKQRVPETGKLEPEGASLATIVIDTDVGVMGSRRILVRSYDSKNELLAEAAQRDVIIPNAPPRKQLNIKLVKGPLDDADMDGVPDLADNCPAAANATQTLPCPAAPDTGVDAMMPMPRLDTNPMPVDMRVEEPADAMPVVDSMPVMMNTDLPAGNIIVNGGFENGTTGWTMLVGAGVAKGPGRSGQNAMYITGTDGLWRQRITQFFDDATYRLSAYGKGQTNGSKCTIGYQFRRADGTNGQQNGLLPGQDWVRAELVFNVPKGATSVTILMNNNLEAECAYDDIELTVMR